jgi:hypothetical protein
MISIGNLAPKWRGEADDSGNTYLCPTDRLSGLRGRSDAELRSICVDESHNPQND